jgi:RNA polymerase sigma-70 factor (ECF subfamily)
VPSVIEYQSIDGATSQPAADEAAIRIRSLAAYRQGVASRPDWQDVTSRIYRELGGAVLRYVRGLGLSFEAAEDVLQETFFRLAGQLRGGGAIENPQAWVFQVAHHLSMDFHRANHHSGSDPAPEHGPAAEPVDSMANPEWICMQRERVKLVQAAMLQLTPRQFRSVQLRAAGLRYREIAADLGVSEQRAIHLVKHARLRLVENA